MLKRTLGLIRLTEQHTKKMDDEFEKMAKSNQVTKKRVRDRINSKSTEFDEKKVNRNKHFATIRNK